MVRMTTAAAAAAVPSPIEDVKIVPPISTFMLNTFTL